MEKTKEVFENVRKIEVDGVSSDMAVKLDFKRVKNGHVKITTGLTTKQLSYNPDVKEAVLQQLFDMLSTAYDDGLDAITRLYEESNQSKVDRAQLTINDMLNGEVPEGDSGPDDEDELQAAPAPPPKKRGRKKKEEQTEIDVPLS